MRRVRSVRALGVLVVLFVVATAGDAQAGTISVAALGGTGAPYGAGTGSGTDSEVLALALSGATYNLTAGTSTSFSTSTSECVGSSTMLSCTPALGTRPILIDLGDNADTFSQGAGAGAFGISADLGNGNDTYSAPSTVVAGLVVAGGSGTDHLDLSGRSAGVTVAIDSSGGGSISGEGAFNSIEKVTGGSGGDSFNVHNGVVNTVKCNGGTDSVIADASDSVDPDCENVDLVRPPVLAAIGDRSVAEGSLLEFTVSASDPDNSPLTYSASNLPAGATFDPAARTFSWIPSSTQAGSYPNVHFAVSDGTNADSEDITITVSDVPDPSDPSDPPGGGGNGGAGDTTAPDTQIDSGPTKVKKPKATFTFSSPDADAHFECHLDNAAFAACTSPVKLKKLKRGKHTFFVRAIDAAGNVDSTPAQQAFKVKPKKK